MHTKRRANAYKEAYEYKEASYTSSLRPHTPVAQGLTTQQHFNAYKGYKRGPLPKKAYTLAGVTYNEWIDTQFTCFTSTKVHILTHLLAAALPTITYNETYLCKKKKYQQQEHTYGRIQRGLLVQRSLLMHTKRPTNTKRPIEAYEKGTKEAY